MVSAAGERPSIMVDFQPVILSAGFCDMENILKRDWIWGGLLIGGAIVLGPGSEAIKDASDICGIARQTIHACAPAILGDPDVPHRDRVPANSGTITVTVISTATSATLGTTPSTTVSGSSR
jgi:hypothetical protein